jgi:Ceramidase
MPGDGGPLYIETDFSRFPVEPWNTVSNLIFLFIVIFWAWKIRKDERDHRLLGFGLVVLLVGFIGGTLYHANRSRRIWLLMDFLPILLLCISFAYSYWLRILGQHWKVLTYTILPFVVLRLLFPLLSLGRNGKISLGYASLAVFLIAPLATQSIKQKAPHGRLLLWAVGTFALALCFRIADFQAAEQVRATFPMGTHWLWHLLGGTATNFCIAFIFSDAQGTLDRGKSEPSGNRRPVN